MANRAKVVLDRFDKGSNNIKKTVDLDNRELREAINVDINKEGKVRRRFGYSSIYSGTNIHSVYQNSKMRLFVENGTLKQLLSDNTAVTIKTGLDVKKTLSYTEVNDKIFFTNGDENGIVNENGSYSPLGLDNPSSSPTVTFGTGSLCRGTYLLTTTFMDADGEESGSHLVVKADTAVNSSIILSNIPQPPDNTHTVNLYMSNADGDAMYWIYSLPYGVTTWTIPNNMDLQKELDFMFYYRMPAGHLIRYFNGHLFIAYNNILWFSGAQDFGKHKRSEHYFKFPEKVSIVEPVETGIFVVSDKTYFYRGTDPRKMKVEEVYGHRAIEGTGLGLYSHQTGLKPLTRREVTGKVAYWMTEKGGVFGTNEGFVVPVMENKIEIGEYQEGMSTFVENEGIRQIVTPVKGPGNTSGLKWSDSVVAQVRRNGVIIS